MMSELSATPEIREFRESDWEAVWALLKPVFRKGETYAYAPTIDEAEAHRVWVEMASQTFVVRNDKGVVLGTYYIKANQPGLGAHVANCGYVVAEAARGHGVAAFMCWHSQKAALSNGFQSMQYNLVASTNEGAIRLWKRQGFLIVGTLPGAFNHAKRGFVDAFVMFKELDPEELKRNKPSPFGPGLHSIR